MYNLKNLRVEKDLLKVNPDLEHSLDILIEDYQNHANLSRLGENLVYLGMAKRIKSRSLLENSFDNDSLLDIKNPIFISGLPRSGTSFLFDLLSQHSALRSPNTWEIFQASSIAKNKAHTLIKKIKTSSELFILGRLIPELDRIHPMHHNFPEECQLITAFDLKSISFIYSANLPNYMDLLSKCSFDSSFRLHKMFLNALSINQRETTWLLKDPCHIQHIKEILNVYPSARFVFIHRHPKFSLPSISNLSYNLRKGFSNIEDKRAIGKQMLFFWHKAAEDLLEKRDLIPKNQIIDIHFNDLIDDPLKVSETIFEKFSLDLNQEVEVRMNAFITRKKTKVGHTYDVKDFFSSNDEVSNHFSEYISYFDL